MPILSHFFKHAHWHTRLQLCQPKWKSLNSDTHTWVFEPTEFHLHECAIQIIGNTTLLSFSLHYNCKFAFLPHSSEIFLYIPKLFIFLNTFLVSFFSLISTFLLHYCFLWPFKEIFAYLQVMKMVCCVCLFLKALWFKPLNLGL